MIVITASFYLSTFLGHFNLFDFQLSTPDWVWDILLASSDNSSLRVHISTFNTTMSGISD